MYSSFLSIIEILGILAGAISGATSAMERKLDPFGVLIISFVTAIGGGTLRDVMVGNLPVTWLHNNTAIVVIFSTALTTMFFGSFLKQLTTTLFIFDALGLGLFTIVGVEIGLKFLLNASVCVALGTITACFGGVIRDVLLNKVPLIFQKEIYALACIIGGTAYYFMKGMNINEDVAKIICILLIFVIRIIAVRYKLALPKIYLK